MSLTFRCAIAALLLTSACGRRYWVPEPEHTRQAEAVAKLYALQFLSDQAGRAEWMGLAYTPDGPEIEYPIAFTFGGTPYSRYRQKFWGGMDKGRRIVHVMYFDPYKIENWEEEKAQGDFPAHFQISVDLDALKATGSVPGPKGPAAGSGPP
jgi:hypothetical protein